MCKMKVQTKRPVSSDFDAFHIRSQSIIEVRRVSARVGSDARGADYFLLRLSPDARRVLNQSIVFRSSAPDC